jgi:hypothetical protein
MRSKFASVKPCTKSTEVDIQKKKCQTLLNIGSEKTLTHKDMNITTVWIV